jgi:hypothetical protein
VGDAHLDDSVTGAAPAIVGCEGDVVDTTVTRHGWGADRAALLEIVWVQEAAVSVLGAAALRTDLSHTSSNFTVGTCVSIALRVERFILSDARDRDCNRVTFRIGHSSDTDPNELMVGRPDATWTGNCLGAVRRLL